MVQRPRQGPAHTAAGSHHGSARCLAQLPFDPGYRVAGAKSWSGRLRRGPKALIEHLSSHTVQAAMGLGSR